MKKIVVVIAMLFLCGTVFSQIYTPVSPTVYGSNNNRIKTIFALHLPEKNGLFTNTSDTTAQIFYNRQDSSIWGWSQSRGFFLVGSGGGSGTSTTIGVDSPLIATALGGDTVVISVDTNETNMKALVTQYQLSQISGGGTYTASNGDTLIGNDIELGGSINTGTVIMLGSNSIDFQGSSTHLRVDAGANFIEESAGTTAAFLSMGNYVGDGERVALTRSSNDTRLATYFLGLWDDSLILKGSEIRFRNLSGHGSGVATIDNNGKIGWGSGGGGTVTSVSGTANRISSSGGTTPVIDISVNYVGQSSITTLGTISSGTWQGTAIGDTYISSASTWNAKQNAISFPNTSLKYHTGYNTFGSFNDSARNAISLTTTGSSGAATYNASTGILNIPNYAGGSSLPLNYIGFGTGSGIAGSPHLTYDSLSFDLVQINGALRTDLTPADLNFSDGSNNVELWPSGLTMNDAGAVNIANLNALGLSLTSGSGSVHYEIQPGQTNTVHLQSPDFSGTQVIPISVNGIFADAAGDIPIPTPFLPVTGTGTATGNVTGDLNGNTLTIADISGTNVPTFTIRNNLISFYFDNLPNQINLRAADSSNEYLANSHKFTGKVNLLNVLNGVAATDSLLVIKDTEVKKVAASTFLTSANFVDNETPSGTINGSNVTFTLANTPTTGSVHLYLNGVRIFPPAFSVSGSTITMGTAPLTGSTLGTDYIK